MVVGEELVVVVVSSSRGLGDKRWLGSSREELQLHEGLVVVIGSRVLGHSQDLGMDTSSGHDV